MKTHTSQFKDSIKQFGRELDSKITYTIDGVTTELGAEQLNSVSPHYEGAVLKSVMKQLDIDSNVEIPVGTILTYEFGVKTGSGYEYITYGNYVVKEVEKQEDTNSYKITCYDKMLYAMKDYEKPTGKNLFFSEMELGSIDNTTGENASNNNCIRSVDFIKVEPNTTYTLSNTLNYNCLVHEYKEDKTYIQYDGNYTAPRTFTTTANTHYIRVRSASGSVQNNLNSKYQLELGTQATSYEDYFKYPTTVRDYLHTICYDIGLELKEGQFSNYDKQIQNELYLDENGNSLNYTYRDVLDEIAQVSGGTICIDADDKLEIRYIQDVGEITDVSSSGISLTNSKEAKLQKLELEGKTTQANAPSPDNPSELVSVGYKNLLNLTGTDQTINGVTFKFYEDGTITANGTATAEINKIIVSSLALDNTKQYTFSGASGGSNSTYMLRATTTSWGDNHYNYGGSDTFTPRDTANYQFMISIRNGITLNNVLFKPMLTKDKTGHNFLKYGKYGIEINTTGQNLYIPRLKINETNISVNNGTVSLNEDEFTFVASGTDLFFGNVASQGNAYTFTRGNLIDISNASKVYLFVTNNLFTANYFTFYDNNLVSLGFTFKRGSSINVDIPSGAKYVGIRVGNDSATSGTTYKVKVMVSKEPITEYQKYVSNTYNYTLDEPLRGIGTYKDKLYIKNNMLYVERKIGKVVLNGSETETWTAMGWTSKYAYRTTVDNIFIATNSNTKGYLKSNYFIDYTQNELFALTAGSGSGISLRANQSEIIVRNDSYTTLANFKTWLGTHNTEVDYVLATPYIEELGSVQVPSTYDGTTYIETTDANTPTMNISYVSGYEEIDEEMLKDVNVNFGEKYGTINTVVLSRSAGADKISLSQPLDLADEEKVAIEIVDNQIMNGNNRADFLQGLLTQLNGLEYYINDYSSTGICYLDLCDMYRVKIGDTSYKCIMFNDSVNITQGLEEQVYTDMPEEAEEDYKYIGDDDRKVTQAYIIADKTRGEIVAVTNKIDETNGRINSVETRQTATEQTIEVKTQNIDADGNITEVTTTNGFTFNAQGLDIHTSDNAFHTTIDEDSTEYKDGDTVVSTTSKDGSALRQLRMLEQNYYSYNASNTSDIMDTSNYDFVDERVEDSGDYVYATFYNGED